MKLLKRFNQNHHIVRLNNKIKNSDWYWRWRCKKISQGLANNIVEKWAECNDVRSAFSEAGLSVASYRVNIQKFHKFIDDAKYSQYSYYNFCKHPNAMEKYLEHYVSIDLLGFDSTDTYIDIASSNSPMPEIVHHLYGSRVYRQDLSYPEGMHGEVIGGDAGKMPVLDGFASKITLHCSFEHFEGDADIRFIRESSRILESGGKLCILPLYMHRFYAIQTDPVAYHGNIIFEEDATIYCARRWGERHSRHYDVHHFISRVVQNMGDLKLKLFFVENTKEVHPSCYLMFVAIFEKG